MRLRLNIFDVNFQLKINLYGIGSQVDVDWAKTELSLRSRYINYDIDCEALLNCEVRDLCNYMGMLIDGTLEKDNHIRFAEPDFEFRLYTAKRLYSVPEKIIYTKGFCDVDICMEMYINFWCSDGLGANQFKMVLDREEITAFATYLMLVVGKIDKNDPIVLGYLSKGVFLPE